MVDVARNCYVPEEMIKGIVKTWGHLKNFKAFQ